MCRGGGRFDAAVGVGVGVGTPDVTTKLNFRLYQEKTKEIVLLFRTSTKFQLFGFVFLCFSYICILCLHIIIGMD